MEDSATTAVAQSATRGIGIPHCAFTAFSLSLRSRSLCLFAAAGSRCTDYRNLGRETNGTDKKQSNKRVVASPVLRLLWHPSLPRVGIATASPTRPGGRQSSLLLTIFSLRYKRMSSNPSGRVMAIRGASSTLLSRNNLRRSQAVPQRGGRWQPPRLARLTMLTMDSLFSSVQTKRAEERSK